MISKSSYTILSLTLILLVGCSEKRASPDQVSVSCADYSWSDVEKLVEPHISEDLYVSLVMQAQSSEYKVSAAADHAIGLRNSYPDSVIIILNELKELDC